MAATLQHCNTATTTPSPLKSAASPNPQLKRLVYSKYRELLGSYNDQANAYIDTLPSYMVHKDNGFNLESPPTTINHTANATNTTTIHLTSPPSPGGGHEMYGSGQRMPAQSTYEAPACVQNAMTRDKKPFTYTPGGIDLSQIKSERMAKRLARNACAEGASGQSQQNRPSMQPMSPSSPGGAAASMGAAAMGMPFQVLPPTPHPHTAAGKNTNGGCAPAPPPPPPSSSNFLNTGSLAPQMNGVNGGRGSAPNSPNMPRKIPAPPPQRFEPPPLGFRPEIKIPSNPMAGLRKVPPPVEKNTFWKDEYKKDKTGSDETSRVAAAAAPASSFNTEENDSVNSSSSTTPQTNASNGTDQITTNGETNLKSHNSDNIDGFKKTMPTTTTNKLQQNQTNNLTNTQEQETIKTPPTSSSSSPPTAIKPSQEQELEKPQHKSPITTASPDTQSLASIARPTPPTSPQQQQQFTMKPTSSPPLAQQKQVERESATPPMVASPPKTATPPHNTHMQTEALQKQQSPKPEFRSVAAAPPQAAVNVFTRQTDSPRSMENATPPRVTESPFRLAQQQRTPVAMSPLAQQQTTPSSASSGASISPNPQAQTVPWRTQRGQTPQQQAAPAQSQPQPLYNNVQQQQPPRAPDFTTQTSAYQGPKPTNVGSLYIAPLAAPTEPQAQHIVRQQLQQQQQQPQRDSPMRQMAAQPQSQQPPANQQLRWMSSQAKQQAEQPAWAARPEENGNVVPSSLNRLKSPPPASFQSQPQQPPQPQYQPMYQPQQPQPFNQGNGFMTNIPVAQNFGAQHNAPAGLRLQINTKSIQNNNTNNNQSGPRERIIPIQLEQTPTYTPSQPNFNNTPAAYGAGSASPAPGYVMRTPNQFVDQGYNNYGTQGTPQRVMSPPMQQQQLNAPRMVQQQQQNTSGGNARTHIVPIAMDNSDGSRGPISKTPIVIQNDLRTPPIQSKSFRILQKITDTIDGASNDDSGNQQRNDNYMDAEPQLQRPTFARQMSAQQARNSPTVEQMRRMKIGHEQGNSTPQTPSQFNQPPRPFYNNNNDYIPPSEQHVPEPKKYTGSAIPSRSFKILQAMTQPENAGEQENSLEYNDDTNDEIKSEHNTDSCTSSSVEPASSASMSSLNSTDSIFSAPTPPPSQTMTYPSYPYPYGYPWYPPPCPIPSPSNGDHTNATNWPYAYAMPPPPANGDAANWPYPYPMPPPAPVGNGDNVQQPPFPPYPYYYPYCPLPPFPPHSQSAEFDAQNIYAPYLPPPPPYHTYPYPVAPSYSQTSTTSSRASSVLPDIIITPSTDDVPSQVILQHHINIEKDQTPKRAGSVDIEDVTTEKSNQIPEGSIVDILTQHLENMSQTMENNLNSSRSTKKSYKKNFDQKSPDDNTSPVQITMVMTESEQDSDTESSDSDVTTKQFDLRTGKEGSVPLQSIRSVTNIQIYNGLKHHQEPNESDEDDEDDDDDDDTTADGESDVFDEDCEEDFEYEHRVVEEDSECEEYIVEDNLSVIYEEESDFEKSSELGKIYAPLRRSDPVDELEKCIEENDDDDSGEKEEVNGDDSNSVTVRLPLKFSFTKSTNAQPITTVEVGKSQVDEDKRNILNLAEKHNSFSVATLDSDNEDSDSCDVSVTISLSRSSLSGSVDSKDSERKNKSEKYPIEDMPEPEKALASIDSSQEDVSFSFSLNKRNKFVGQTLQGDLTNNVAKIEEAENKPADDEVFPLKQSTEELDFFATLMATKMQAQKIKEQSASYWGGKSMENKTTEESSVETRRVAEEDKEYKESATKIPVKPSAEDDSKARTSFWAKYSTNTTDTTSEMVREVQADDSEQKFQCFNVTNSFEKASETESNIQPASTEPEEIEDIWANREDEPVVQKKPQYSYWDKYSMSSTADKETVSQAKVEIEDIWASRPEDDDMPVRNSKLSYETKVQEPEEVVDIWAERQEDLPAVKNLSKKLDSLESAKNSFWSTVAEANKASAECPKEELKTPKQKPKQETITEITYSPTILRHRIDELAQSLNASVHVEEEPEVESQPANEQEVKEEDIDFWAQIEQGQEEQTTEAELFNGPLQGQEEQESSFWNDHEDMSNGPQQTAEYDPLKYPEEPREVDTDEEIDFWAEIEAKGLHDDDDVTFHRAATFWASRDRKNSVDETPYKPVPTKAFAAKLPDELPTENLNIWAALEAHKGEEPVLVDPQVEEEKELAQEFDGMSHEQEVYEDNTSSMLDVASVHEPVVASVWSPPQWEEEEQQTTTEEPDFWAEIEKDTSESSEREKSVSAKEEVEAKRNNYRKAMAFFTTSIDDHKEESNDLAETSKTSATRNSYEHNDLAETSTTTVMCNSYGINNLAETSNISATRNSYVEEDQCKKWYENTEEAQTVETPKKEVDKKAKKPPKKESKPKNKTKSPPKVKANETKPSAGTIELPEVYVEPTLELKRLPNGLPDLEVSKFTEERKVSVRDRISVFETGSFDAPDSRRNSINNQSLSVDSSTTRRSSLSRNSSSQRSESEIEEDDSGVTDMNKLSETETESESFPELRKMSSYQRAATHSRLFKLLQDDTEGLEEGKEDNANADEFQLRPSRRKVVHNVSITRKQNPKALTEVETMSQRRERLSLPLRKNTSIDADNPSTPNSPASPIMDQSANQSVVSDKLVSELVQSLLLKSDSTHLRKLPMEKLQAAAKRVLEEELDSLENTSVDSTPAMTPNDLKKDKSYAEYYNTWSDANGSGDDIVPSKSFKVLQDSRKSPWTARCPRVLSSKTINRDLARVTESPEIFMRNSKSPECFRQSRENSDLDSRIYNYFLLCHRN